MADRPILLVAGLGRCGTTLLMTMLARGGFPVAGPAPAYEVRGMTFPVDMPWLRQQSGRAVKWIDPMRNPVNRNDLQCRPVIISLRRNPVEQAASQLKLLQYTGVSVGMCRSARRAFAKSVEIDQHITDARLLALGSPYHLSFEQILGTPIAAANKLAAIVRCEFGETLDEQSAASAVVQRSPACAPDMAIEMELMRGISA